MEKRKRQGKMKRDVIKERERKSRSGQEIYAHGAANGRKKVHQFG